MNIHSTEIPGSTIFSQPTLESIAFRIRKLRKDRGWSLIDVEHKSKGRFKAVVLGSYERGDRALSVKRAIDLATLYSVPLHYLLAEPEIEVSGRRKALILDLRKVRTSSGSDEKIRILINFISWISNQRNDWNGEVMSLREGDLSLLGLLLFSTEAGVIEWLKEQQFLFIERDPS
ncbi:MAG: helix-turn-helix domain-containing protein [Actinobacteria bacterium]|nr:helix-turn-helix domain-containing protein [Actinomycetota bacterium]